MVAFRVKSFRAKARENVLIMLPLPPSSSAPSWGLRENGLDCMPNTAGARSSMRSEAQAKIPCSGGLSRKTGCSHVAP